MVSLEHLVDHYMRFPDGLPIQIRNPLSTKVNLTPKAPSPSQALIAKHKNKKDPELPSHNSNSSSSNSSITLCSEFTEKISPPPPRDMPNPNLITSPPAEEDLTSPDLPPRVPPSRDPRCNTNYPTNLKPNVRVKKYENNETLRRVRHSR